MEAKFLTKVDWLRDNITRVRKKEKERGGKISMPHRGMIKL